MDTKVFSIDRSIQVVLNHALGEYGFTDIAYHEPSKNLLTNRNERADLIIIDTDDWCELDPKLNKGGILLLSSNPQRLDEKFRGHARAVPMVIKPFSLEKLHAGINQVIFNQTEMELALNHNTAGTLSSRSKDLLTELEDNITQYRKKLEMILGSNKDSLKAMFHSGKLTPADFLIKKVLVVETDRDFSNILINYLRNIGVFEVEQVSLGLQAWQLLRKETYNLVVLDWGLQDMSSRALYNRMRSDDKMRYLPVCITLSGVEPDDDRDIEDDYCAGHIKKPFQQKLFAEVVGKIVLQSQMSTQFSKEVHAFLTCAIEESFDFSRIKADLKGFFAVALRRIGQVLIYKDELAYAEEVFKIAWQMGDVGVTTMTNLARIYHLGKKHDDAKLIIKRATVMGPGNLERLCLQGEIGLHLGDNELAQKSFQAAFQTDRSNQKAIAGLELSRSLDIHSDSVAAFAEAKGAAPFNLLGIKLARDGKFKEALTYYKQSIQFAHTRMDRAKVLFNIGLCYKRAGLADQATIAFQKSYQISGNTFKKALDYIVSPDKDDSSLE